MAFVADWIPGDHYAVLYQDGAEYRDVLGAFVYQGTQRHERVVYLAHADAAQVNRAPWGAQKPEVEEALARGQVRVVPPVALVPPEGRPDPIAVLARMRDEVEEAQRDGYRALRVAMDMTGMLGIAGTVERLLDLEELVQETMTGALWIGLCLYDRRRFGEADLVRALRSHPHVVVDGEVCPNVYHVPPGASELEVWLRNLRLGRSREEALARARKEALRAQVLLEDLGWDA